MLPCFLNLIVSSSDFFLLVCLHFAVLLPAPWRPAMWMPARSLVSSGLENSRHLQASCSMRGVEYTSTGASLANIVARPRCILMLFLCLLARGTARPVLARGTTRPIKHSFTCNDFSILNLYRRMLLDTFVQAISVAKRLNKSS